MIKSSPPPLDSLPNFVADFISDVAERMPTSPDYLLAGCVVATGSVIGAKCGVRPKAHDDWVVVPNVWGMVIGHPGTKKTASLKTSFAPLEAINRTLVVKGFEEDKHYKQALDKYQTERVKVEKVSANNKQLSLEETGCPEIPDKPKRKRLIINDATPEVTQEYLAENPNGLLVFRDELFGLIQTCKKSQFENFRALLLECWNGTSSFSVDRIGRGSIFIERCCASVFGGIQPDLFCKMVNESFSAGMNDGLLQRFQAVVWPENSEVWKLVDRPPNEFAVQEYTKFFEFVFSSNFAELGASRCRDLNVYVFEPAAQKRYYEWLHVLHNEIMPKTFEPVMKQVFAKYESFLPQLSLIAHCWRCFAVREWRNISLEAVETGIELLEYFRSHTVKAYSETGIFFEDKKEVLLARIVAYFGKKAFYPREVYERGWSGFDKAGKVKPIINNLVAEKSLVQVAGNSGSYKYYVS